jgi:hypothetical protein
VLLTSYGLSSLRRRASRPPRKRDPRRVERRKWWSLDALT